MEHPLSIMYYLPSKPTNIMQWWKSPDSNSLFHCLFHSMNEYNQHVFIVARNTLLYYLNLIFLIVHSFHFHVSFAGSFPSPESSRNQLLLQQTSRSYSACPNSAFRACVSPWGWSISGFVLLKSLEPWKWIHHVSLFPLSSLWRRLGGSGPWFACCIRASHTFFSSLISWEREHGILFFYYEYEHEVSSSP